MGDLCYLSAGDLLEAYRTRSLSPVEVTKAVLERIDRLNPILNCFCLRDDETPLALARASEERWMAAAPAGPLDGVPISIKDLLLTRGWPTLCGSRAVDPSGPWEEDDPAVARLRESGAVLIGKTTTPEFGNSGVTNSPLTGLTVNPWDIRRTTGGSSGGSVAAVAAGLGPLSVGTDAGGSIRTPPSFCGLVGLKPTFGRVPQYPGSDWSGLACSGPIARTVADAARMMNVITRPDSRDPNALPYDGRDYRAALDGGVKGLRIAFSPDLGFMPVTSEVADIVKAAAARFEALGACVEIADPGFEDPLPIFNKLWSPIAAASVAHLSKEQRTLLGDEMLETIEDAKKITLEEFLDAQRRRNHLAQVMAAFHRTYDLLLTPTAIVSPFETQYPMPPEWDRNRSWVWELPTFPFNFTRQPAATVPCGFTKLDLPVGIQIVGPVYADALVLRAAHAYQQAFPTTDRRPPLE